MEKIVINNVEIWEEGDILIMKTEGEIKAQDMEEAVKTGSALIRKHKIKHILSICDITKMPLDARKAAAKIYDSFSTVKKAAVVCTNPVTRAVIMFLMGVYKLPVPVKVFSNAEDAKKWFREKE